MKKQIVRISILQSSKMAALMYSLLGFLYSLFGVATLITAKTMLEKIIAIIFLVAPIWLAVLGFLFFALAAAVYNQAAKWIGGFEVEVEDIEDEDDGEANS